MKMTLSRTHDIPDQLHVKELARLGERRVRRVAADQLRALRSAVASIALAVLIAVRLDGEQNRLGAACVRVCVCEPASQDKTLDTWALAQINPSFLAVIQGSPQLKF